MQVKHKKKTPKDTQRSNFSAKQKQSIPQSTLQQTQSGIQIPKALDSLDPQLVNFTVIYQNQQTFYLRFQNNEADKNEQLIVRVSQKTDSTKELENLKIELMSDIDIFFHLVINISKKDFDAIKSEQQLNMHYFQLPGLIIQVMQDSIDILNKTKLILFVKSNKKAQLIFEHQLDFKVINLIQLDLIPLNEQELKQQVMFKYNLCKAKQNLLIRKTGETYTDIAEKNAYLYEQIIRNCGLITKE